MRKHLQQHLQPRPRHPTRHHHKRPKLICTAPLTYVPSRISHRTRPSHYCRFGHAVLLLFFNIGTDQGYPTLCGAPEWRPQYWSLHMISGEPLSQIFLFLVMGAAAFCDGGLPNEDLPAGLMASDILLQNRNGIILSGGGYAASLLVALRNFSYPWGRWSIGCQPTK